MIAAHSAEIRVRRYNGVRECDVVVFFRGQAMTLRCRDYDQAVEWARIECKAYKVAEGFTVERRSTAEGIEGKRGASVSRSVTGG
jgi:hypothetical protein